MAIWDCGSSAHCCQPAVAEGFIYADLWGELNTHIAPQTLFTQSSPGRDCHCYKLSPFQAHWGRWHCISFLRPACLFTAHVGVGLPPSPVEFSSHCHFYKLSRSWLLGRCHHSCLLQLAWCEGFPLPPLWCSGHPALFATCLFCLYCLLLSFFFFFLWVGVSLSRGLCWSGPGLSVGFTMCRLAHLVVHVFPSHLGAAIWMWYGSPPGFSV
jgi:hypothetical protein